MNETSHVSSKKYEPRRKVLKRSRSDSPNGFHSELRRLGRQAVRVLEEERPYRSRELSDQYEEVDLTCQEESEGTEATCSDRQEEIVAQRSIETICRTTASADQDCCDFIDWLTNQWTRDDQYFSTIKRIIGEGYRTDLSSLYNEEDI